MRFETRMRIYQVATALFMLAVVAMIGLLVYRLGMSAREAGGLGFLLGEFLGDVREGMAR